VCVPRPLPITHTLILGLSEVDRTCSKLGENRIIISGKYWSYVEHTMLLRAVALIEKGVQGCPRAINLNKAVSKQLRSCNCNPNADRMRDRLFLTRTDPPLFSVFPSAHIDVGTKFTLGDAVRPVGRDGDQ
jgi:hypothetical protein